jgi:hypothetical protein
MVVGTAKALPSGGSLAYLGFRPRDDQSRSLGYDERTWFDILQTLGAYPSTGDVPDSTEVLSRTGDYLWCRFPNGALAVAPHLRGYEEFWGGGFGRKPEDDAKLMRENPPPSPVVHLDAVRVNGRTVSYDGQGAMTFRVDAGGDLVAFCGYQCQALTVDGRTWTIADKPLGTAFWAPVEERRRVPGGAVMAMLFSGEGTVRVPAVGLPGKVTVVAEGRTPGSRGETIPARIENGALVLDLTPQSANRLLYVVEGEG